MDGWKWPERWRRGRLSAAKPVNGEEEPGGDHLCSVKMKGLWLGIGIVFYYQPHILKYIWSCPPSVLGAYASHAHCAIDSSNSQDSSHHLGQLAHFNISTAHTIRLPTTCLVALPLGSFLATVQNPSWPTTLTTAAHMASPTHQCVEPQLPRGDQKQAQTHLQDQSWHPTCCASRPDGREETVRDLWQTLAAHELLSSSLPHWKLKPFSAHSARSWCIGEAPGMNHGCHVRPQSEGGLKRGLNWSEQPRW